MVVLPMKKLILDIEKIERLRIAMQWQKQELAVEMGLLPSQITYMYQECPVKYASNAAKAFGGDGKDFVREIEHTGT